MEASICEKVTLDGMSSQCSSVRIRSATLLVRGSNRISRAAARRTPDNGLRRHFGALQEVRYSSRGMSGPTPSPRRARTQW